MVRTNTKLQGQKAPSSQHVVGNEGKWGYCCLHLCSQPHESLVLGGHNTCKSQNQHVHELQEDGTPSAQPCLCANALVPGQHSFRPAAFERSSLIVAIIKATLTSVEFHVCKQTPHKPIIHRYTYSYVRTVLFHESSVK